MPKSIAIVAGQFHQELMNKMVSRAKEVALEKNFIVEEVCWVPGAMEYPLQLKRLLIRESIEGAVVLGIIEKGKTDHGLVMGQAVTKAIIDLELASMKPIGLGIIGPGVEEKDIEHRLLPYAEKAVSALDVMFSN